ncbi:putative aspartic protease [Mycena leptocephala]|nr:putative aspartic protease [Mycena leptocephala]
MVRLATPLVLLACLVSAAVATETVLLTVSGPFYTVQTTVGSQTFNLIVDTGSAFTWVGAQTKYLPGTTSTTTQQTFSAKYADDPSNPVTGVIYRDQVGIGGLVIDQQVGAATNFRPDLGADGIIGFGPVALSQSIVIGGQPIPTVMDNLLSQKKISTEVLGVSLTASGGQVHSSLTLGGIDPSKFVGSIVYIDRTTSPAYINYWGIDVTAITFGGQRISGPTNALVDTGAQSIYLPSAVFQSFLTASGGVISNNYVAWTTMPTGNLAFTIGEATFFLTPAQYTMSSADAAELGLPGPTIYGWIARGTGAASFQLGNRFLISFYSVFDTINNRIGFAPSAV